MKELYNIIIHLKRSDQNVIPECFYWVSRKISRRFPPETYGNDNFDLFLFLKNQFRTTSYFLD
jgi:hypothetical protein